MVRLVLSGAGWAVKRPEHGRVVWLHQHVFQAEAIVSFLISVVRSSHDVMVHRDISDMNGKDSGTGRVRPAKIASEITEYQPWKDRVECHPVQYQWAKGCGAIAIYHQFSSLVGISGRAAVVSRVVSGIYPQRRLPREYAPPNSKPPFPMMENEGKEGGGPVLMNLNNFSYPFHFKYHRH